MLNDLEIKQLYDYNKSIYENEVYKSENRLSKNIMPGFFNRNKILFVGQNPGQPSQTDVHQNEKMPFDEHEVDYFAGFLKCRIGIYIKAILDQLRLNVFDIGFTNIVKYSTINNVKPTSEEAEIMMPILIDQINFFQPEKIVAIGSFASDKLKDIKHVRINHPASHNYSFFRIAMDAKIINGGS